MGRLGGGHRAQLRDGDLEVGEDFEQIGLKGLVGAVEFVDEEDGGEAACGVEGGEERAPDEEILGEDVAGEAGVAVGLRSIVPPPLRRPDMDHLLRVVPFVCGRRQIQPLVALQPNQRSSQPCGQRLRDLGLTHPGLALKQQRAPQLQRQKERRAEPDISHIALVPQQRDCVVDRRWARPRYPQASTARFAITVTRCARYSAPAAVSDSIPSDDTAIPATASPLNDAPSASSIAATRNTPSPDAPVTATLTPAGPSATITPATAYFDAGFANFA